MCLLADQALHTHPQKNPTKRDARPSVAQPSLWNLLFVACTEAGSVHDPTALVQDPVVLELDPAVLVLEDINSNIDRVD